MQTQSPKSQNRTDLISRRHFLQLSKGAFGLGLAAVQLGLQPARAAIAHAASPVGVLLPQSTLYPALGAQWLSALKRALPTQWRPVPMDGNWTSAKHAAESLIDERVRWVASMADPRLTPHIAPLLAAQQVRLVSADFGARLDDDAMDAMDVDAVSLYQWQANWTFGNWQAQHAGKRGFILMSFQESGYDTPYAFQSGFESAGGEIVGTLVHDAPVAKRSMSEVIDQIRNTQPDVVYVLLQGAAANAFVTAYRTTGLLGQLPLAGSPFVLQAALQTLGADAAGVQSWRTWRDVTADPLTALAKRTAQRIVGGGATDDATIYVSEVRAHQGQPYITSIANLGQIRQVAPLTFTGPRTGWLHSYLGI